MTKSRGTLSLFASLDAPKARAAKDEPPAERRDEGGGGPPREPPAAITVSALLARVERALYSGVGDVVVVGELSSVRPWRTGHLYFDLKDERSTIACMMRDTHFARLGYAPRDGMKVVVTGRIGYWRPQSKVQVVATKMEPVGEGDLLRRLEALKARLANEGLFDVAKKKPLPRFPRTVGLVTSPQGAVLRDMIKVLRRRSPGVSIVLSSTRVQGEGADQDIARALARLDASGLCDVILVGRGGGSLEDLMAFHSERVVRAIAAAKTPIVSSVGHETDVTLADLAADVRAATPSHAAELAVASRAALAGEVAAHERRLTSLVERRIERARHALLVVERRMPSPRERLGMARDDVEELARVLTFRVEDRLATARAALFALARRLEAARPDRLLQERRARLVGLDRRLVAVAISERLRAARVALASSSNVLTRAARAEGELRRRTLHAAAIRLEALSPLRVLDRGYALLLDERGALVSKAATLEVGARVTARFSDGEAALVVEGRALTRQSERASDEDPSPEV